MGAFNVKQGVAEGVAALHVVSLSSLLSSLPPLNGPDTAESAFPIFSCSRGAFDGFGGATEGFACAALLPAPSLLLLPAMAASIAAWQAATTADRRGKDIMQLQLQRNTGLSKDSEV